MGIPVVYVPKGEETQNIADMLYAIASITENALSLAETLRMEIGFPFKPREMRELARSLHERDLVVCEVKG